MKKNIFGKVAKWAVIGGFLMMMSTTVVGYVQAVELTAAEKYWLTYMREEEKLARDVYNYMYNKWGAEIFNTIALSEQRHMDAVKKLLDRYGVEDPAANTAEGVFVNPALQAIYNQLIAQGDASLVEALQAGVYIEETDINDLNVAIAASIRRDIKNVFNNLLLASQNHLKAFISNLAAQGVVYEP